MSPRSATGALYQLVDPFVLFHYAFVRQNVRGDERFWSLSYEKPVLNAWRGLSFERICFWHIPQIKQALGISGILSDVYAWRGKSAAPELGDAQIDMLIDRGDRIINICEMKFSNDEYAMDAEESRKLRRRVELFRSATRTRKGLMPTLISCYGLKRNANSAMIQAVVTLDDLFKE